MRKSQIFLGRQLMYITILILVLGIIYIGYSGIQYITSYNSAHEIRAFYQNLENAIDTQRKAGLGSSKQYSFLLDKRIETVCFVDRTGEIDDLTNLELDTVLATDDSSTIFFSPFEESVPVALENFRLDTNPLCVSNTEGMLKLTLTDAGEFATIKSHETVSDCVSVRYNGDDLIDIVFLGYGYDDLDEFSLDVKDYTDEAFLSTEPFSHENASLNFYLVPDFTGLDCSIKGYIMCDSFQVNKRASNCPHDYTIILFHRSLIKDILAPVRSSAFSNFASINTADNDLVVIHEFGHIFGDLADEYTDESYYADLDAERYPNCDKASCPKWSQMSEAGCFQGCSLNSYYRATENSIMRNYYDSDIFGIVNERVLSQKIGAYKGGSDE